MYYEFSNTYKVSGFFDQCHQATIGDMRITAILTSLNKLEGKKNLPLNTLKLVVMNWDSYHPPP